MRLPDGVRSRAVLISTGAYTSDGLPNLPAVYHNIEDLVDVVTGADGMALPTENCVSVIDAASPSAVMSAMLAAAQKAEDLLLVYYAGHGVLDPRGRLFLSLTGTLSSPVAWDALDISAIREVIAESRAENRVLILDCCFSGRAIEAMGAGAADIATAQVEVRGTYTLTATSENAPAHAPAGEQHTTFTGSLLALLKKGDPEAPDLITLDYIYDDLLRTLRARNSPEPRRRGTDSTGRLALVRNSAKYDRSWSEPSLPVGVVDEPPVAEPGDQRFDELSHHPGYPMIRRLVGLYIKDCIPDPLGNQKDRWNITALPKTSRVKGQRRLLTLNCGPQEVLYITELTRPDGSAQVMVCCNIARPTDHRARKLNFANKNVTGQLVDYQRSVWAWKFNLVSDLSQLQGPIPTAEFKTLARGLNTELMEAKSPYGRYHNADLAADLLTEAFRPSKRKS
ncbi:caspase family protein [Nocardia sp. NPDC006630]|uniref:caspase family protein n=1 Tax=Nocardia sp. NPDC006630 TaxID=3157181 RepID=UPI0033B7FC05